VKRNPRATPALVCARTGRLLETSAVEWQKVAPKART
jgi:hypothetical protein